MKVSCWASFVIMEDWYAPDCDPRGHGLSVVQLEDKWFYAIILPINNGPCKYNRDARKAWANWRCRWHVSENYSIRRDKLESGSTHLPIDLLCCSWCWGMEIKASIWEECRGCL